MERGREPQLRIAIAAAALAVLVTAPGALARGDTGLPPWPGRTVVIGYASDAALDRALRGRGASVVAHVPSLRAIEVRPRGDVAAFAAAVQRMPGIDYAQPPAQRRAFVEPALAPATALGGAYQWQFAATGANRVPARVARAARRITIAVIDSGVDVTAPDLEAKKPRVHNAIDNSRDVTDDVGHGTFVASLAAGSPSNGDGIAGMGGEARLIAVKAGVGGRFSDFETAAAIAYAVDFGAEVVNLSLGGDRSSLTEARALAYALARNVLVVAAAGNEHLRGNRPSYPAALLQPLESNGVGGFGLSVGATTIDGTRAPFSNTGGYISLAAPGADVFGAVSSASSPKDYPRVPLPGATKGLYGYSSGTSFAAPQVAGAAALVWGANEHLSARQVADILKATASGAGAWNPETGFGIIDVAAAVDVAAGTPAVSLRASSRAGRVRLSWRGSTRAEQSYRLFAGDEPIGEPTTERSAVLESNAKGATYEFSVESYDAAGRPIARSARLYVTVGQARSSLGLRAFRVAVGKQRRTIVFVLVGTDAPDVGVGRRLVRLERLERGRWRFAGMQRTDAGGRAIWVVPKGRHTIRASMSDARDLAGGRTRALTVRG